jgi:hypothetical protein
LSQACGNACRESGTISSTITGLACRDAQAGSEQTTEAIMSTSRPGALSNVGSGDAAGLAPYVVEKGKPFLVVVDWRHSRLR